LREHVIHAIERGADLSARVAVRVGTGLCAGGAAVFAATTQTDSHRVWAVLAALGYFAAFTTARRVTDSGWSALRVAGIWATLVPTGLLVLFQIRQPEVGVVERSAQILLETGSPYLSAPAELIDVNPYPPGMALFGLPRQLFGDSVLGDARLWFLGVFILSLAAASLLARPHLPSAGAPSDGSIRALLEHPHALMWAVLARPLVALHGSVGGHELPVIGLVCLGFALAARSRPAAAGIVLGVAALLKQTAWPAVAVTVMLLAAVAGATAAWRCALIAVGTIGAVLLPVLLGPGGSSSLAQLAGFPLAAGQFVSPAASPTPGVWLANAGPAGRSLGLAVLTAAILGIATWLIRRPPRDLARATVTLALAETVALLVLPTSRFGYLVFPAVLLLWTAYIWQPSTDRMEVPIEILAHPAATTRRARSIAQVLSGAAPHAWFIEREVTGLRRLVGPGDVCLDVGAEYGLYTWTLADLVGPEGHVHAVEPQPGLARFLRAGRRALRAGNVTVHQVALSDTVGTGTLSRPSRGPFPVHGRAFLADNATGLGLNEEFGRHHEIQVTLSTLDALVDELGLEQVDFIKADIEGAEAALLAGAQRTLQTQHPALMLEVEEGHLARLSSSTRQLLESLRELGYEPYCWSGTAWLPRTSASPQRNVLFLPGREAWQQSPGNKPALVTGVQGR